MTPFENALVAHLVGDWLLQNDWMARHKSSLLHPAAWIHGAIHGALLALALGLIAGVVLGVIHLLTDTRLPQKWWTRFYRQTEDGPSAMHVQIWGDQVIHIGMIALWLQLQPIVDRVGG